MRTTCPELEVLDRHAADPSHSGVDVAEHVAACEECQKRMAEMLSNFELFAELGSAAGRLAPRLRPPMPMPRAIGGFEILREIGRGGMGIVYEAAQRNPERRVALKVLRADYAESDERRRLFDREIRALARLRHAGITAIFESGSTDSGPFYAMEFVHGQPLHEHLSEHRPDLHARLRLFVKICAAISFAHQHGVIHRDLKPGNILIDEHGDPKVLDFGLARIVDPDSTAVSLAVETGRLVGTLAYMSPEQARGAADEIDLRSDVYSLGVILFEMLTGALPYDVPRNSMVAAVRSILESSPQRPSGMAALRRTMPRAMQADIDTILLKALEKSPSARYQSVAAFGEDLDRLLSDQPIIARPASTYYHVRKFARRNRVLVGGVLSVFLALGLGLVTTQWQAMRARDAEIRARAEAVTSAEISRFMTTMFASVDPAVQGPDVRVVQLLRRADAMIDRSFTDQPRVAIALREAIGDAYKSLTLYADAEPHFQRGLDLARLELGEDARETLRLRYSLAETLTHTSPARNTSGDLASILAAQERLFGPDDRDTLATRSFTGVVAVSAGRMDEGERILRETLAGRERTLGTEHDETVDTLANLGIIQLQRGQLDQARRLLERAHDITLRVHGPEHARTILFAGNVATLARTPAELEAVEPVYRDLAERAERVFGATHQTTLGFLSSLSLLLELRCKFSESEAITRDLVGRLDRSLGGRHGQTIDATAALARRLTLQEKYDQAERLQRDLRESCGSTLGASDARTLNVTYDLIHTLNGANNLDAARSLAESLLTQYAGVTRSNMIDPALTRIVLADILRKQEQIDAAVQMADRALNELRGGTNTATVLIAWAESVLGACLAEQGRHAEAEGLLMRAHDQMLTELGACHPAFSEARTRLAELYQRWHEADPSAGHDRRAAMFRAAPANPASDGKS